MRALDLGDGRAVLRGSLTLCHAQAGAAPLGILLMVSGIKDAVQLVHCAGGDVIC